MTSLARRNRVKEAWLGLPETWRTELSSAFHTFVPAFVASLVLFFQTTESSAWTKETLLALIIAALAAAARAGFKALSVWVFSRVLPDPKNK